MFKRIRRMYQLSKKDGKSLELLESLTPEQIDSLPEEGDGKALFFSEGTEKEYDQFLKEESGMKKWYDRLKDL